MNKTVYTQENVPINGVLSTVKFNFYPGHMGTREEPPESPEIDILEVSPDCGDITGEMYLAIEEYIFDTWASYREELPINYHALMEDIFDEDDE